MTALDMLKTLDGIAQQANSTWRQCESLKMRIAEHYGISLKEMDENGIFVEETNKQPNAELY